MRLASSSITTTTNGSSTLAWWRRACPARRAARARMRATASSSRSAMVSKSSAAKRANRARPGPSSMPPLGSMAQTCTVPAAMAGHRPRISDHSTEPFPAPVTPATRTCEPADPYPPGGAVLDHPDGHGLEVNRARDGQSRHDGGEGVVVGQFDADAARAGHPDPAPARRPGYGRCPRSLSPSRRGPGRAASAPPAGPATRRSRPTPTWEPPASDRGFPMSRSGRCRSWGGEPSSTGGRRSTTATSAGSVGGAWPGPPGRRPPGETTGERPAATRPTRRRDQLAVTTAPGTPSAHHSSAKGDQGAAQAGPTPHEQHRHRGSDDVTGGVGTPDLSEQLREALVIIGQLRARTRRKQGTA